MPYVLTFNGCQHKQITWIYYEKGGLFWCEDCKAFRRIVEVKKVELV